MKKKMVAVLLAAGLVISLAACGGASETGNTGEAKTGNEGTAGDEPAEEAGNTENTEESTLTYGSGDYTRINPAMDEHCEINVLLFDGLTAHDADDQVVPGLAESWDYDEDTYTYTFHIRDGIKWDTFAQIPIFIPEFEIQTKIQNIYKNIQQNKLEISTLNNFADTFITTLSSC